MPEAPTPSPGATGSKKVPRAVREREMLDVATGVFAERGYHAASMDEIAEQAGISKPMLYAYFESKEGLCRACIERARTRLFQSINEAVADAEAPDAQLWLGVQAFFAFVDDQRDAWALLERGRRDPFADDLARVRREVATGVAELLRDAAAAEGADPAALERTEPLARALIGAGESLATWWLEQPDVPRENVALLLMNFAWLGFSDLVRGTRWLPSR